MLLPNQWKRFLEAMCQLWKFGVSRVSRGPRITENFIGGYSVSMFFVHFWHRLHTRSCNEFME